MRQDTPSKIYNVLFVCTHNSARSVLAEGLMNGLGHGRFKAFSAGSQPRGTVHPLALQTLAGLGLPTEGYRSKDWAEFSAPGAPVLDFIFTVCDNAAGEVCPLWPGQPVTAHWGVPDPSAVQGNQEQQAQAFVDAAVALKRRIELMLALPLATLDKLALQRALKDIGSH
jgi:arsenate reductase